MQKKNPNNKKKLKVSNSDILKELKKSKLKKPLKQIKPQKSIKKTEMLFTAEIIAYNILDKILTNVFNEIRAKKTDKLVNIFCSEILVRELTHFTNLSFLRYESSADLQIDLEPNPTPPSPPKLDNWKIHRLKVIKHHRQRSSKTIREKKSTKKLTKSKFKISKTQRNKEEGLSASPYAAYEKNKKEKKSLRNYDSFPSFPLSENLFKKEKYLTKEQEKEIEIYREEILKKEENKKKREKLKRRFAIYDPSTHKEENDDIINKQPIENNIYRGRNVAVTPNGEIVLIQSVNIKNLKSDFIEITSKMKKEAENEKISKNNKKNFDDILNEKEIPIEVNKENEKNKNLFKTFKKKENKLMIIGGSPFNNIVPEPGVTYIEDKGTKSGGNDFVNKYKKFSHEQFEQTLEKFQKANRAKNKLLEVQKENEILSPISRRNSNINNNTITNSQIPIMRNTLYNISLTNNIDDLKKTFERASSLPDLFTSTNTNMNSRNKNDLSINNKNVNNNNTFNHNDLAIKNSFNFTNYNNKNNIKNQTNNFIKTSSSFQNLISNDNEENKNIISNKNQISTVTNFFMNFNKNYKNFSKKKQAYNSLRESQNLYNNILIKKNWETIDKENEINNIINIPKVNIVKKILDKNILRVRSNLNEIYNKKMDILNKLTFRGIEFDGEKYNKIHIKKNRSDIIK